MTASVKQTNTPTEKQRERTTSETAGFVNPQSYFKAERKALWYFNQIQAISDSSDFLNRLLQDYKSSAISKESFGLSSVALPEIDTTDKISQQINTLSFLQQLDMDRKLTKYLTKSIRYIFIRDLGKSLADTNVKHQIDNLVNKIRRWIRSNKGSTNKAKTQLDSDYLFELAKVYRLESTFEWLMGKLAHIKSIIPSQLDQTDGMRKLVKIIAGVVLHQVIDLNDSSHRRQKLEQAIRLGYCYGLTYPLVDDLLDSSAILNEEEKDKFNQTIRRSLLTGKVASCPQFNSDVQASMEAIYHELKYSFEYIQHNLEPTQAKQFFEQAYIFFEAQNIDRSRRLTDKNYSNRELFLPIILKAAGCRLIARDIVNSNCANDFHNRTFCFGIYNQFNDDIKDIFDDLKEGNITPYTYFLSNNATTSTEIASTNTQVASPYKIYWSVVFYLINVVYKNEEYTKQLLLERSINAHKSLRESIGASEYNNLRKNLLFTGNTQFDQFIDRLVFQPSSQAWFDKLISQEVSIQFTNQDEIQKKFKLRYDQIKTFIESKLSLTKHHRLENSKLVEAANYSILAGGKRLRSVLAYVMSVDHYGFTPDQSINIIQLLEYMHTASIIFDDKPSQDNADLRRGNPSLHTHYQCEATAELAGVFLMMRAVEVQSQIKEIEPRFILDSLSYAANTTQAICEGQLQDLKLSITTSDVKQLEQMSLLKTGLAIEASLMIPAILAGENDIQKEHIKHFAKHLGLAFQIKDDLLDFTSNENTLGKPVKHDEINKSSSFVTCLGEKAARTKLFYHYHKAKESLEHLNGIQDFMEQILDYVVYRNH